MITTSSPNMSLAPDILLEDLCLGNADNATPMDDEEVDELTVGGKRERDEDVSSDDSQTRPSKLIKPAILSQVDHHYDTDEYDSDATTTRSPSQISDPNESDDDSVTSVAPAFRPRPLGMSRSSIWLRSLKAKVTGAALKTDNDKLKKFRASVADISSHGEVLDAMHVRCAQCGQSYAMKAPYGPSVFRVHLKGCDEKIKAEKARKAEKAEKKATGTASLSKAPKAKKSAGMKSLLSFFPKVDKTAVQLPVELPKSSTSSTPSSSSAVPKSSSSNHRAFAVPCGGIGPSNHPNVQMYLDRTGALGGGASSVTKIAKRLYRKAFILLNDTRKTQVKRIQIHEWKWRNDHASLAIFSTSCLKEVMVTSSDPSKALCSKCASLLTLRRFKIAIARPRPPTENYKYIPISHRGSSTIAACYARCKGIENIIELEVSFNLEQRLQKYYDLQYNRIHSNLLVFDWQRASRLANSSRTRLMN